MSDVQTEAEFQDVVLELAGVCGWMVHHVRPARMKDGSWRTPVQGDVGFPDLVLVRDGRIVFAELKSERGRLSAAQKDWLGELRKAAAWCGVSVVVELWRPSDWDDVVACLT